MEYGRVAGVEKRVSRIVFGCAIGAMWEGKDVSHLLDKARDVGINTFDTARVYGRSEESLGRWLNTQNREELVVISKCCHPSPEGEKCVGEAFILEDLETSLNALRTDYIDIYLLHRDNEAVPASEIVETLNACRAAGKIRAFGVSNWRIERIIEANAYAKSHGLTPLSCSSPHFSLAEQIPGKWNGGCLTLTGKSNAASRTWYRENAFSILAFSSLANGFFSGKMRSDQPETRELFPAPLRVGYFTEDNFKRLAAAEALAKEKGCTVAQIALKWLFTQGLNVFALVGSSSPERIAENAAALDITLTREEAARLNLEISEVHAP